MQSLTDEVLIAMTEALAKWAKRRHMEWYTNVHVPWIKKARISFVCLNRKTRRIIVVYVAREINENIIKIARKFVFMADEVYCIASRHLYGKTIRKFSGIGVGILDYDPDRVFQVKIIGRYKKGAKPSVLDEPKDRFIAILDSLEPGGVICTFGWKKEQGG